MIFKARHCCLWSSHSANSRSFVASTGCTAWLGQFFGSRYSFEGSHSLGAVTQKSAFRLGKSLVNLKIHPSGVEPETFGFVDRIAGASKAIPTNELRTFAKSPAAFEQHPNDNSSHSMSLFDSSSCSLNTGSLSCCDRDSTEIAQLVLRWPTLPRQVQQAILLIAKVPLQTNPSASTKSNEPSERHDAVDGGAS